MRPNTLVFFSDTYFSVAIFWLQIAARLIMIFRSFAERGGLVTSVLAIRVDDFGTLSPDTRKSLQAPRRRKGNGSTALRRFQEDYSVSNSARCSSVFTGCFGVRARDAEFVGLPCSNGAPTQKEKRRTRRGANSNGAHSGDAISHLQRMYSGGEE